MKSLREYLKESEDQYSRPVRGDNFAINIREECLLETYIVDETDDGIVLHADDKMMGLLESYGFLSDGDISQLEKDIAAAPVKPIASMEDQDVSMADAGEYDFEGDMAKDDLETIVRAARRLTGMLDDNENMPEWVQSKINKAADYVDTAADYIESNKQDYVSADDSEPNPVARAVLNRILMQHPGVIATHGPQKVMDAVDELADYVNIGPDDEIGSSDVSAWTRDVIRMLAELPDEPLDMDEQGVAEGDPGYDKHSFIGKIRRGREADNKGWGQLGNLFAADNEKDAEKALRKGNRYYNMTRGSNKTPGGFPKTTVEEQGVAEGDMSEAKYQGREVPLGKPMKGDVAKSKVYVRDPKTGNVKKVNFGDPNMKIKKNNPARRKSFRARHNCDNPGPRTKARYWSCRAW